MESFRRERRVSHGRNAKYSEGGGMCGALSQYLVTTTVRPSVSAKLKVEKPVSMPACSGLGLG